MNTHRKRHILTCQSCKKRFRSSREDTMYCSPACKNYEYRRRQKKLIAQAVDQPDRIEQIAAERRQKEQAERDAQVAEAKRITYEMIERARRDGTPIHLSE